MCISLIATIPKSMEDWDTDHPKLATLCTFVVAYLYALIGDVQAKDVQEKWYLQAKWDIHWDAAPLAMTACVLQVSYNQSTSTSASCVVSSFTM